MKFILFEICLASSVRSFIFLKILKFSVVLSYHVFPSFNIFSLSLGSDDRVLALLLWSLGTWVLLTVLSGPLMYPASWHQHHQLSCFFDFFPHLVLSSPLKAFECYYYYYLVVVTLVFCFKLSSCYSFTLSVDEEPPVQFAFEDIFFPCDVALVFVESSCCLCHLDICAWPSVLPHTFSLLLDESRGVNGD